MYLINKIARPGIESSGVRAIQTRPMIVGTASEVKRFTAPPPENREIPGKADSRVRGSLRATGFERGAKNGSFCGELPLRHPLPPNSRLSVPKNSSRESKS